MELKGKPLSLLSKILAVVLVIGALVLEMVTRMVVPIDDVIKSAVFVALVFAPVDMSLWVKTFFVALGNYHNKCISEEQKI